MRGHAVHSDPDGYGLLVRVGGGWVDSRIPDIARELVRRDPRLELRANCDDDGSLRDYQVWWQAPDARWHYVSSWDPHEAGQILADVEAMNRERAGYVPLGKRIRQANERRRRQALDVFDERYLEMLQHACAVQHDADNPRVFFGQAGLSKKER